MVAGGGLQEMMLQLRECYICHVEPTTVRQNVSNSLEQLDLLKYVPLSEWLACRPTTRRVVATFSVHLPFEWGVVW